MVLFGALRLAVFLSGREGCIAAFEYSGGPEITAWWEVSSFLMISFRWWLFSA